MRPVFIVLPILVIIASCNSSDTTKATENSQAEEKLIDTTLSQTDRHVLIEELKRIQQILASNNKEKISNIFEFPLSDSAYSIYVDDTAYHKQRESNGDKITEAMFLQFFNKISAGILISQLNNLFRYIKVDSLLHKDNLEYEAYIKSTPCYYSYKIKLDKSIVTLRMDMKSNTSYKSKKTAPEDDIPENSSEICEHDFWWIFRFDGKKLHLTNISGAD